VSRVSTKKTVQNHYKVTYTVTIKREHVITEYVTASSKEEAGNKGWNQLKMKSIEYIQERAPYSDGSVFKISNIIENVKKSTKPNVTKAQLNLLKILDSDSIEDDYGKVHNNCEKVLVTYWPGCWSLHITPQDKTSGPFYLSVNGLTCDSLLRKGLIEPKDYKGLSEKEIGIQKALGTLSKVPTKFIVNEERCKELRVKLQ